MLSVQHNMLAWNAERQFNINTKSKNKKAEKLSSGYRINRAADDAAGFAISEKMRRQIRGFRAGTEGAEMGVSWVQIGEGALNEAHDILHRMNELSIKSQNGTNTEVDRAYMQAEFDQLQSELDRISQTTVFNEQKIFREHEAEYHQITGNIKWDDMELHEIMPGRNKLVVTYREDEDSPQKTITLEVGAGTYTTHELIDELDDSATEQGSPIHLEFTEKGICKVNLDGGQIIDTVSGDLSYLLFETYNGGGYGTLIGTTDFGDGSNKLPIVAGQNDKLEFTIEYYDGGSDTVDLTLDAGSWNKEQIKTMLRNKISAQLSDDVSGIVVGDYGNSIMISSEKGIVTGFKGNMFKIEVEEKPGDPIYNSVFYDNIRYGTVTHEPASVVGNAVLTTDERDEEHNKFDIIAANNKLVLQPNTMENPVTITIAEGRYTAQQMVDYLNDQIEKNTSLGLKGEIKAYRISKEKLLVGDRSVTFEGVELRTVKEGPDAIINIDEAASTVYDTLFMQRDYNIYTTDAAKDNEETDDHNAFVLGSKVFGADTYNPASLAVKNGQNDSFMIRLKDQDGKVVANEKIDIATSNKSMNVTQIKTAINTAINANANLKGRVEAVVDSNRIKIVEKEDTTLKTDPNKKTTLEVYSVSGNNGYRDIFQNKYDQEINSTVTSNNNGALTIDLTKRPANEIGGTMYIEVDGVLKPVNLNGYSKDASGVAKAINDQLGNSTKNIEFSYSSGQGKGKDDKSFSMDGTGKTTVKSWSDEAEGASQPNPQGKLGFAWNVPAQLTLGPDLKDSMVINSQNNKITITMKNKENGPNLTKTISLSTDDGDGDGQRTYTKQQLADELEERINEAFNGVTDGVTVDLSGKQLVITAKLGDLNDGDGNNTYIAASTGSSTFLSWLNTTETAASCSSSSSNQKLASSVTLVDGVNDSFTFTYNDGQGGSGTVTLDLLEAGDSATLSSPAAIAKRIDDKIKAQGINVHAENSGGYLKLSTTTTGNGTSVSYSTSSDSDTAKAIFANLAGQAPARIIPDADLQEKGDFGSAGMTFNITVNGTPQSVTLKGSWDTRQKLVDKIQAAVGSKGLKATLVGNRLCLETTTATGSSATISMVYDGSDAMKKIFGTTPNPGVKATASGKKVTLQTIGGANKIRIDSVNSGGTVKKTVVAYADTLESTYQSTGYHSVKQSKVTSVPLQNSIEIDQWNKQLTFGFSVPDAASYRKVLDFDISVDEGTYTPETLAANLQTKLGAALKAKGLAEDLITASIVTESGKKRLKLEAKEAGSKYQFSKINSTPPGTMMGGGFYHHVLCQSAESTNTLPDKPTDINGEQTVDKIYAVGRKDVVNEKVVLKDNISDMLVLDLTYVPDTNHDGKIENDKRTTITLELDLVDGQPKTFQSGEELRDWIQEKLNEQLAAKAAELNSPYIHENMIRVGVGEDMKDNIWGSKDTVALNFSITTDPDIATPAEGYFYIDGVRGNAAFETFYYTEGELIPAYIIGTKDISGGVELTAGNMELIIEVDGEEKTLDLGEDLKPGKYSGQEIVSALNKAFKAQDIPLAAEINAKGALKISHQRMGKHTIEKVRGSARDELFFVEEGRGVPYQDPHIRLSSNDGDYVGVYSPAFSTTMLGVNSICVSDVKYAEKATERLKGAISKVSEMRSTFGAVQNRLEHILNNNRNKEENTQAAESQIRDADIAKEMMDYANMNIIQQAGQAVLAQANQSREGLLALLG